MTDPLIEIADLVEELCDPRQHREQRWGWSKQRNRVRLKDHVTVQAGLITQLHEAIAPLLGGLDDGGARGVPRSTPPLQIEALDRYLDIETKALSWCSDLGIQPRTDITHGLWLDLPATVRALVGAGRGDRDRELLADLRRWRSWAATMTGWQSLYSPHTTCPVSECEQLGTLRINMDRQTAVCVACRSWWDEGTIGILALYIQTCTGRTERVPIRSGATGNGGAWHTRTPATS